MALACKRGLTSRPPPAAPPTPPAAPLPRGWGCRPTVRRVGNQHSAPACQNNCICPGSVLDNYNSKTTETFYDILQLAKLYQYSF